MRSIIWQLVLVAELLTAVFQGKELSPGQFFPPTRMRASLARSDVDRDVVIVTDLSRG